MQGEVPLSVCRPKTAHDYHEVEVQHHNLVQLRASNGYVGSVQDSDIQQIVEITQTQK